MSSSDIKELKVPVVDPTEPRQAVEGAVKSSTRHQLSAVVTMLLVADKVRYLYSTVRNENSG